MEEAKDNFSKAQKSPKKASKAPLSLIISLILCFISALGAHLVQSNNGSVSIKDLRIETALGRQLSLLLFIPENATKENPAPAIVTSHGWYNSREMQDLNYVELARRGYVVAAIDMYGHGNSDPLPRGDEKAQGTGMYDAVEMLATLPYVDKNNIGVTGHSNGARAANFSVMLDNAKYQALIKAVLLIGNDAVYKDESNFFTNIYGKRDVGIVAGQYDEFFFRTYNENGTVTAPRDYIHQENAQSFLNYGKDPNFDSLIKKDTHTYYMEEIDGKNTIRIIYNPDQIHAWNHISKEVAQSTIDFFELAMPAPNPMPSDNQIWPIKLFFNCLGLLGFGIFVLSFTKVMLRTSFFSSLLYKKGNEKVVALPNPGAAGWLWFLASLVLSILFSAASYVYLFKFSFGLTQSNQSLFLMMQEPVLFIGLWSVLCALFTIILLIIGNKVTSSPVSLEERGVKISLGQLCKTIIIAIFVVFCAYGLVFAADILFKADYRLWVLPLKAFTADKFYPIVIYLPFFVIFYTINSIAINCFNYFKGIPSFINIILLAFVNGASSFLLLSLQYFRFFEDGRAPLEVLFGSVFFNIIGIWLFPIAILLTLSTFFTRAIFMETKNPYLGAFIFALIVTIISCTNTLTYSL